MKIDRVMRCPVCHCLYAIRISKGSLDKTGEWVTLVRLRQYTQHRNTHPSSIEDVEVCNV